MHLPYRYLLVVISLLSIFFIVRGSDEHFQFSSQPAILIPGTIQVNLIGFKEDGGEEYGINPIQFQQLLEQTYKLIKPDLSHDAKDSFIHFFIRYIVNNQVKKNPLTQLEDLIASEIVSQLKTNSAAINNILSIPVSTKLEKLLNEVYEDTTPNRNAPDKYGVTIVNPSFPRIVKQVISELPSISPHLIVGYNWNFNGIPTNAFLASKPYAFIDVTALAVYVGPSSSTHGVRNPLSIPNLVEFEEYTVDKKNVIFEAALGSAIHSLSTHVFFPDISFAPYTSTWNQIFVPVMVFKNHGTHVELQEQRIHQELRKIFHNTIKLDVKFGTHSLHDHKHVSMAVSKSLRTHLVNELDENGHYITKGRQYLDSKTLAVELRRSADALASLLLDNAVPGVSNKITLPVYIFSLHGLNPELLLDNDELVSVEHDAVIILSTDQEKVPLPLIADMNTVYINATDPNRHIIAGVAMSQGLVPPYKVLSNLDSESEYDYTWAFGNHPFGPFSNSMTLPDIFAGNIRRNAVLSRIHKGVSIITETIAGIDNFAEKYLHGVLESTDDISTWIESAYHGTNPETNPLLYTGTVDRLHAEIMDLSTQLDGIHHKLRQQNYEEAFALSQSFIFSSKIVKEYSKQELEAAEIRLQCCRIHHSPPSNIIYYAVIATALSIVAICAPLFVVFGYMIYKKFDNMKKNPPSQKRSSRKSVLLS